MVWRFSRLSREQFLPSQPKVGLAFATHEMVPSCALLSAVLFYFDLGWQ